MAAAGTLSRPTSAQGSYALTGFQTYYSPPSPTVSQGGRQGSFLPTSSMLTSPVYVRPGSAGAIPSADSYSSYRKPTGTRPVAARHATSTQYAMPSTPDAPTRIYGTRAASHSADDLSYKRNVTSQGKLLKTPTSPEKSSVLGVPVGTSDAGRPHRRSLSVENYRDGGNSGTQHRPISRQAGHDSKGRRMVSRSEDDTNPIRRKPVVVTQSSPVRLPVQSDDLPPHRPRQLEEITAAPPRILRNGDTFPMEDLRTREVASGDNFSDPSPSISGTLTPSLQHQQNKDLGLSAMGAPTDNRVVDDQDRVYARQAEQVAAPSQSFPAQSRSAPAPAPVPPRAQTPVPPNYVSEEKSMSLKSRLRRALSFSSATNLSEMAGPDSRSHSRSTSQPLPSKARSNSNLYGQSNRSSDDISISSTASSASVMLRKIGHGLSKKTKRSLGGIFSGSNSKLKVDSTSGGISRRETTGEPIVGGVNYVNAESDVSDRPLSPPREIFPQHTRAQGSISSIQTVVQHPRVEVTDAVENVDGHGSVAFPRLSQEISVDDRSRRASMHLERPLPIDLESKDDKSALSKYSPWKTNKNEPAVQKSASGWDQQSPQPIHLSDSTPFTGKSILKRPVETLRAGSTPVAHNAIPPISDSTRQTPGEFDFSFEPVLDIEEFSVPVDEINSVETPSAVCDIENVSRPTTSLTFSPRITIHDTYTANEYDRRGETSTCNRLTPLLAQRIKEELNAYKMDEMDVAEESKVYTHFFS